jgi:hypothetical protein
MLVAIVHRVLEEQEQDSSSATAISNNSPSDIMNYIILACAFGLMSLVICGMGCGPDVIIADEHDYRYQQSPESLHESYISVVTRAYCAPHSAASFDSKATTSNRQELSAMKKRAYLAACVRAPDPPV